MDIEKQAAAGDIFNISGGFNLNGGTLNVDQLIIKSPISNDDLLSKEKQHILQAQFSISYLDLISVDFQKKPLILRSHLISLLSKIKDQEDLPLVGIPGTGKTCVLFQLSASFNEVVYISLKGRSLSSILSHLINKINLKNNLPLINLADSDAAIEILQGLLLTSEMTFLLDDCETNPGTVKCLLALRKIKNHFIYASRNDSEFRAVGVEPYLIDAFSIEEVKEFLIKYDLDLDVLQFNEVYNASKGNPLYLFYFTQYQITPLPKDVLNYHQAIWGSLTSKQQECLIFIALSYEPVPTQVITELLNFEYLVEVNHFMSSIVALIKNDASCYDIFHPAFKEFIVENLKRNGILKPYKLKLGDYYLSKNLHIQAAYVLVDEDAQLLKKVGFEIVYELVNSGDLEFAIRVMLVLLPLMTKGVEKGYLSYHLAINYRMLNQNDQATYYQEQSLDLFKKLRNKRWYQVALMNKAMTLVEDGKPDEGLAIADLILKNPIVKDTDFEGQLLVNFSKIYVDLHEYEKAAQAAIRAYRSFEKLNYVHGMISSLTNLASSIGRMNDYHELSEAYAKKLLEYSSSGYSFNTELIALNILTSLKRQEGDYQTAKKYGEKAVRLCQKYKLEAKVILNLINFANILRDEKDIDGAVKIYHEALLVAIQLGFTKDESRIYWILSAIYKENRNYVESIKYIDLSITQAKAIIYINVIAHVYEDKAEIYLELEQFRDSASYFALSTNEFKKLSGSTRERSATLKRAVLLYLDIGNKAAADELLLSAAHQLHETGFVELSSILSAGENSLDIHKFFKMLSESYLQQTTTVNLVPEYVMYLEYCHRNPIASAKHFCLLLSTFANNLQVNRFAKPILAILLEQSKTLISTENVKTLLGTLVQHIPGYYCREIVHENIMLLKLPNGYNLEIAAYNDELICLKLAVNLVLFLSVAPELLVVNKPLKEKFCKIHYMDRSSFNHVFPRNAIPAKNKHNFQTYHPVKMDWSTPEMVVVNEHYEKAADLVTDINNKHNMYCLGATIKGIRRHFYHISRNDRAGSTKEVTRKLAYFFGLTDVEEIKMQKSNFHIDIEKLDQLIMETKKMENGH